MTSENEELIKPASSQTNWGIHSRTSQERVFLEGPKSRSFEFYHAFEVFFEMLHGFRKLHFLGPCVTVYGSARFTEDHDLYRLARETGKELALRGFVVMTGGGPGLMEAANRGAKDAQGRSAGCNITLLREQTPNAYLDSWIEFKYFMVRKFMLAKYSYGFIAMPGGFGTMDELFEVLTLIQNGKMKNFPVVLVGLDYWMPLKDLIENRFIKTNTIDREDANQLYFTDSAYEAAEYISKIAKKEFQLTEKTKIKPIKFLGE